MIKNQLSQSISNFFVLITAPHAFCPKKIIPGKHECDFRALNIANLLAKMLRKKNIEFRTIYSEVLRSNVDFNRNKLDLTPSNNSSIDCSFFLRETIGIKGGGLKSSNSIL